jgi:alpha-beta hydrolase superfamily lysophospholipase
MSYRSFALSPTPDGQTPIVHCWAGDEPVRGVMVIAHGMGEHALRYAPLADSLTREGYLVCANDHRGHGQTVKDVAQLGDYGPEGWRGLIDDQLQLLVRVRQEHDVPILLLGHSMGSMVVQHILTEASDLLDGAALSGTTAVDVMAAATAQSDPGTDLFAAFNAAFEPVRTESDWLSRDPDQVDLYVNDPLCGFAVTDDGVASLMEAGVSYSTEASTNAIRKDLPIYFLAGEADPVGGGGALVTMVADRYRKAGMTDVAIKLYSEARHEVFNETNRKEVEADLVAWANRVRDSCSQARTQAKLSKGASA